MHLTGVEGALNPRFEPAPDLLEWLIGTFIAEDGPLFNPEHAHLAFASIGVLWTSAPNSRLGRRIVGQAEFKPPAGTMGKWARARAQAQLSGWFGGFPDFLLTFEADYASTCSDTAFCAICEHELFHCGQARDEFGVPKFTQEGLPIFRMRGHDVEEFIGVIARYGATDPAMAALVQAANAQAAISTELAATACGTCRS